MNLIPVLDIIDGRVVHAVRGDRACYQPLQSKLCDGSDPVAVAAALLAATGGDTLYVADLDALMGRSRQRAVISQLCRAIGTVNCWLDAAFETPAEGVAYARTIDARGQVTPVIASESLRAGPADVPQAGAWILSLDMKGAQRLDPSGAWTCADDWPQRVIVMTLDRVGSAAGPDLATMSDIARRGGARRQLFGAGGIRDRRDLQAAADAGAQGWLVASALHDGSLARRETPEPGQ